VPDMDTPPQQDAQPPETPHQAQQDPPNN